MRRFGGSDDFLSLIDQIRSVNPDAAIRSNFIVGFPGETAQDVEVLASFLSEARLDAIGVFSYSDEEGTEAAGFEDHLDPDEIALRTDEIARVADEVMAARAQDRIGQTVRVINGRSQFQGPEDGTTSLLGQSGAAVTVGKVVASEGADLIAQVQSG